MNIWVRVGDAGEYEAFDNLDEAVEYLNELNVGRVDTWLVGGDTGIETPNYHDYDYISLYWGYPDGTLFSALRPDERVFVEDGLLAQYI